MKKIITLISISSLVLLAWCSSSSNNKQTTSSQQTKQEIQTLKNTNKPLINVAEKVKKAEQTLKKIWLTWEKLKQEVIKQKAWFEIIASLKWDARKKYIIENQILPGIIRSWKVSKKCTTTNLNNYVACLYVTKTPIDKLLKQVPKQFQNLIEKDYYTNFYSLSRWNLLKYTNNPIALQAKKDKIQQMFNNWVITNPWVCSKLPEQETQNYCKSLFNQK